VEAGLGNLSSGVSLSPIFFPQYWLGLSTVSKWPYYSWDDGVTPGPDYPVAGVYYRHWGNYMNTSAEPNEGALCAVADYNEAYGASRRSQYWPSPGDTLLAWGWNDQQCNRTFPYICQYPPSRERPHGGRGAHLPACPPACLASNLLLLCGCLIACSRGRDLAAAVPCCVCRHACHLPSEAAAQQRNAVLRFATSCAVWSPEPPMLTPRPLLPPQHPAGSTTPPTPPRARTSCTPRKWYSLAHGHCATKLEGTW
jgi:hypothetical protein